LPPLRRDDGITQAEFERTRHITAADDSASVELTRLRCYAVDDAYRRLYKVYCSTDIGQRDAGHAFIFKNVPAEESAMPLYIGSKA